MKRDKITFVFFLIPIFLFPGSLKHFSFDKGKNPNLSLTQKQIKSIKEGQRFHSKKSHHEKDKVPVNSKPTLSEKSRESNVVAYRSRKLEKILRASSKNIRSDKDKRPNLSPHRQKAILINDGKPYRYNGPLYRPDQVLVKFKSSLSVQMIEAAIAAYQSTKLKRIPILDIYQLQIPENVTVEEMVYVLRQNPDVEFAQPNYLIFIAVTPHDRYFEEQYALNNFGQEIGPPKYREKGTKEADIKAITAWNETKGKEDIIIAVLDTGVDLEHADIKNKIQSSGRDFVNDDFDATDDNSEYGHGTHVAGIAAAETNNQIGIAGVAWKCKILPVKVVDENGDGDYFWLADGIMWAANNGADVINMSVGGPLPAQEEEEALKRALKYAYEKNIVIVAAAGNYDPVWGSDVFYPAAYDEYCLAVTATDYNDLRTDWSNFGPQVDVAAPGDLIFSLFPEDFTPEGFLPYAWESGTSMAAPHVAGMAALIKSIKPWLTNAQIMNVIRYTADDINSADYPGEDDFVGYGRINMKKALVPIEIKSP